MKGPDKSVENFDVSGYEKRDEQIAILGKVN